MATCYRDRTPTIHSLLGSRKILEARTLLTIAYNSRNLLVVTHPTITGRRVACVRSVVEVHVPWLAEQLSILCTYLSSLLCHLPLFSLTAHLYDPEHPLCKNFPVQNTALHPPCLHHTLGARSYRYCTPITHTSPTSLLWRNIGVRALLTIDCVYTLWLKYG